MYLKFCFENLIILDYFFAMQHSRLYTLNLVHRAAQVIESNCLKSHFSVKDLEFSGEKKKRICDLRTIDQKVMKI